MSCPELQRRNAEVVWRSFELGVFAEELEDRLSDWFAVVLDLFEDGWQLDDTDPEELAPPEVGVTALVWSASKKRQCWLFSRLEPSDAPPRTMVCVGQEVRRWRPATPGYGPGFWDANHDVWGFVEGWVDYETAIFRDFDGPCHDLATGYQVGEGRTDAQHLDVFFDYPEEEPPHGRIEL